MTSDDELEDLLRRAQAATGPAQRPSPPVIVPGGARPPGLPPGARWRRATTNAMTGAFDDMEDELEDNDRADGAAAAGAPGLTPRPAADRPRPEAARGSATPAGTEGDDIDNGRAEGAAAAGAPGQTRRPAAARPRPRTARGSATPSGTDADEAEPDAANESALKRIHTRIKESLDLRGLYIRGTSEFQGDSLERACTADCVQLLCLNARVACSRPPRPASRRVAYPCLVLRAQACLRDS